EPEIGVFAVGQGKPLVEAADAGEHAAPVREIGRDPRGAGEAGDVALPVGWPAVRGQGNAYAPRGPADQPVLTGAVEISSEVGQPIRTRHDVVVEEGNPVGP